MVAFKFFIGSCQLLVTLSILVFILSLSCLLSLLFLLLYPFVIQYCILMGDSKVDDVMFVAVRCDGDTVDGSRFLFEHIVGDITGGFQGGFNIDIRSGYRRIFDELTPSGEECFQ